MYDRYNFVCDKCKKPFVAYVMDDSPVVCPSCQHTFLNPFKPDMLKSWYNKQLSDAGEALIKGFLKASELGLENKVETKAKVKDTERALDIVKGVLEKRRQSYTHPLKNFTRIGRAWGALLDIPDISPDKVAVMMGALKGIRATTDPFLKDNDIDGHGYWDCHDQIMNAFREAGYKEIPSKEQIDELIKKLKL